jgi:arylsulfatase A-like enzyme
VNAIAPARARRREGEYDQGMHLRLACCVTVFASIAIAQARQPNVVFVLADQWRAQAAGYAGDPNARTPNLDRLEKVSVDFVHAVSSNPVCSPCRASLLTGQRSTTHGIFLNDAHLSDDARTLAKVLAGAGYDTAIIGKWHLNGHGRLSYIPQANRQGFSYWKAMECTHEYNHSLYFADDDQAPRQWDGYDAIAQTADACAYIRDHAGGPKPFLLCLWWGPPHNPFNSAPAKYRAMYDDPAKIHLRPNVPKVYADAARKDAAGYYAHIAALDDSIGTLWQALRDAGEENDTILIFSSDHGEMLYSNGYNRKQKPWDESVRVPMLWHYPPLAASRIATPMATEDVMPTILGLCGVPIPSSVEGLDYSGFMKHSGANPNPDDAALIECVAPFAEWNRALGGREYRGVRTSRYTYVRDLKGAWLLYDNDTDPYQMKNLADDPSETDVQRGLDNLLNKNLAAAQDEFGAADFYLEKWGYKNRIDAKGALPAKP